MMARALFATLACVALSLPSQEAGGTLDGISGAALELLPVEAREQVTEQELEVARLLESDEAGRALAEGLGELGKLYYVYGLSNLARGAWIQTAEIAPSDFRWQYYIGVLDHIEGDLDSALSRFARVLELRPEDQTTRLRSGRIELELGRLEEAAARFESLLEAAPELGSALAGLGRIALAESRFEEAVTLFERALATQGEGSVLHHQLGIAYRGLGDLEQAGAHLARNQGVRVSISDPLMEQMVPLVRGAHFHARVGIQALKSGRVSAAVESLERAARLDPESAWIRYNLAVCYREAGRLEEARSELTAAVGRDPEYRNAHFNLGTLLASQGDFAGAARHFRRAREIDPQDYAARMELAVAFSRLGDGAGALAELELLVLEAPRLMEARLALATLLASQGRGDEARRVVEEALELDATDEELALAHTAAGRLLESDPVAAAVHLSQAVALDPVAPEPRFRLALDLGRQGRFSESARQFEELVQVAPEEAEYRLGLTMALLLAEEYPSAKQTLEEARASFPESLALAHSLARLLATCPDDLVRDGAAALVLARQVLEAQQTLDHAETLAMALAEVGRFNEAAELQRQVVAQRGRGDAGAEVESSRRYLHHYGQGKAVRAPWMGPG